MKHVQRQPGAGWGLRARRPAPQQLTRTQARQDRAGEYSTSGRQSESSRHSCGPGCTPGREPDPGLWASSQVSGAHRPPAMVWVAAASVSLVEGRPSEAPLSPGSPRGWYWAQQPSARAQFWAPPSLAQPWWVSLHSPPSAMQWTAAARPGRLHLALWSLAGLAPLH